MRRHVALVGLSGAGKSVAGQAAARILDGRFVDIDVEIERREGISIREIFEQRGEKAFRRLESELVGTVLAGEPSIVATGGGWAAEPGNMERAAGRSVIIHLRVDPRTAATRLAGATGRPLLGGDDREGSLRTMLERRAGAYALAEHVVDTVDRTPEEVGSLVAALAQDSAGW